MLDDKFTELAEKAYPTTTHLKRGLLVTQIALIVLGLWIIL